MLRRANPLAFYAPSGPLGVAACIFWRKLVPVLALRLCEVAFTQHISVAALIHAIANIIAARAHEEMIRIHASRDIAFMANFHAFGDVANEQFKRRAVGALIFPVNANASITRTGNGSAPFPTPIGRWLGAIEKSLFQCHPSGILHNCKFHASLGCSGQSPWPSMSFSRSFSHEMSAWALYQPLEPTACLATTGSEIAGLDISP